MTVAEPARRIVGVWLSRREAARCDSLTGRECRQNGQTLFDALAMLITTASYQREPALRRGVLVRRACVIWRPSRRCAASAIRTSQSSRSPPL